MTSSMESGNPCPTRRQFAQTGMSLGAAGVLALGAFDSLFAAEESAAAGHAADVILPGNSVLFQGDSITDAGRKREIDVANSPPALGDGYAWLAANQLLVESPSANLKIFNRGISGNKVDDLAARWQTDCLDLKPNVLSILIGVNDYWHMKNGKFEGTAESYEHGYRDLLQRTKQAIPQVRLIICEPFLLLCGNVKPEWVIEFAPYRAAARKLAEETGAVFVPFQAMFDLAVKVAPPATWAIDGIHPSHSGAALMARWWLKKVGR